MMQNEQTDRRMTRGERLDLGKLRSRRPPIVAQSLKLRSLALLQSLCVHALLARFLVLDADIELGVSP